VPGFLFAMAFTATAQDGKTLHTDADKAENTMDVQLGGSAGLRYVFATENVETLRGGSEDAGRWPAWANITLDVAFSDSASFHMDLYTGAVDGVTLGAGGYATQLGGAYDDGLSFRALNVQFEDALTEGLTITFGAHAISFGLMADRLSYNPAWSTNDNDVFEFGFPTLEAGALGETQQAGISFNYGSENIGLNVFWTVVSEGGPSSSDERHSGVIFTYDLSGAVGDGSAFGAMLLWDDRTGDANMFSFNPEILLSGLVENMDLYLRIGANFGDIATDVGAGGISFGLGVTYSFANDSDSWVAFMFDYASGDDEADDNQDTYVGWGSTGDGKYDMLVLEGQLYGLNVRTNYWAAKISGGMSFSVGSGRNNLHVRGLIGTATMADDTAAAGGDDDWGFEIDIVADYILNDRVSWTTGLGALVGSGLLDEDGVIGFISGNDDDSAIVFFMGPNVSF
jgi:hypothetical protein